MLKRFISSIVLGAFFHQVLFSSLAFANFTKDADYTIELKNGQVTMNSLPLIVQDDGWVELEDQNDMFGCGLRIQPGGSMSLIHSNSLSNTEKSKTIRLIAPTIHVGDLRTPHRIQLQSSQGIVFHRDATAKTFEMESPFVGIHQKATLQGRRKLTINCDDLENRGSVLGDNGKIVAHNNFIDKGSINVELELDIPNPYRMSYIGNDHSIKEPYNFHSTSFLFALQEAMGQNMGSLHLEGKTGTELVRYLCTNSLIDGQTSFESIEIFHQKLLKPALVMVFNKTLNRQEPHLVVPKGFRNSQGGITAHFISIDTTGDQTYLNILMKAENNIDLRSGGSIRMETETYQVSHHHASRHNSTTIIQDKARSKMTVESEQGSINLESGEAIGLYGVDMIARKKVKLDAETICARDKLLRKDIEHREQSKRNIYTSHSHSTTEVIRNNIKAQEKIKMKAQKRIETCGGTFSAGEEVLLDAPETILQNQAFQNTFSEHTTRKSKSGKREWTSHSQTQTAFNPTVIETLNLIFEGGGTKMIGTKVYADKVQDRCEHPLQMTSQTGENTYEHVHTQKTLFRRVTQGVRGGQEVEDRSELHVNHLIRDGKGSMHFENVDLSGIQIQGHYEETKRHLKSWEKTWSQTKSLIPDKAIPVIQLVVALAANGLIPGGGLLLNTAFSTILSHAAGKFAQTGNMEDVGKSLIKNDFLKGLVLQVASTGLVNELAPVLGVNMNPGSNIMGHLGKNAFKGGVDIGLGLATGQNLEETFKQGLRNLSASTLGSVLAYKIGLAYGSESIDPITHKLLHAFVGGLSGAVRNPGDIEKGIKNGAIGAIFAELAAEVLMPKSEVKAKKLAIAKEELTKIKNSSLPFSIEELTERIKGRILDHYCLEQNLCKLIGAASGAFLSGDIDIASHTAITAIDNNAVMLLAIAIGIAYYGGQFINYAHDTLFNKESSHNNPESIPQSSSSVGGHGEWEPDDQDPDDHERRKNQKQDDHQSTKESIKDIAKKLHDWFGEDYKIIHNKAGDPLFISKDGLRKMRVDIKNPHGDKPHIHFEILKNGKWKDAIPDMHRIYPK